MRVRTMLHQGEEWTVPINADDPDPASDDPRRPAERCMRRILQGAGLCLYCALCALIRFLFGDPE